MKAVVFHNHGPSGVLVPEEVPDPQAGPGDVLVKVEACALNHLDIWVRKGLPGVTLPLPHILGCDVSGTIAECGKGVKGFRPGDRVIVMPGMGCGECERCRSGWDSLCDSFNILGFQINGGYAEKVAVPARRVVKVGPRWSFEEWAAVPLAFLTAWHMLHTLGEVKKGEKVLIHAAGSGIGSAAIQIARLAGCEVITDLTDIASPMIWLKWSTLLLNLDYLFDALEEQVTQVTLADVPMNEGVSSPDQTAVLRVRSIFENIMKACDGAEESFEYDDAVGSLAPEKSEAEINKIIRKMVDEVSTD